MRVEELAKCPHCGDESLYKFYLGTDRLICNKCDKSFDIKYETKVTVSSFLPERTCNVCGNVFISNDSYHDHIDCPKCGWHFVDNYR